MGKSAGRVFEEEATCPLKPGETGALGSPSYKKEREHFGVNHMFRRSPSHEQRRWRTIGVFFLPLLNKLRNAVLLFCFFSLFRRSTERGRQ